MGLVTRVLVAGCLGTGCSGRAQAPADFQGDRTIQLAPGESATIPVALPPGMTQLLTAEQTLGAMAVNNSRAALGDPEDPRTNPAGLAAQIAVTLLGRSDLPTQQVSFRNLSPTKPAAVRVRMGPVHPEMPADTQTAQAEAALAHAEALRGRRKSAEYRDALRSYDQAIALRRGLTDQPGLARALAWKAMFLLINQSDAPAAGPVVAEALSYLPLLDPVEAANCHKIAAYVEVQSAQYDRGRADYVAAIALFETTHDLYNQEVVLDNLSRVERLQGKTEAALDDATRAQALAEQIGDVTRQLKIKAEIGAIDLSASRLEAAYAAYQGALMLLKQAPDPTTEGYVWSDLGVLYTLLHQPVQARNALDEAMAIWKRNPNPAGELNTLDDYGELWMGRGNLPLARSFYDRGLTLARGASLVRPEIFLLRGRGATFLLENDLDRAGKDLDDALALSLKVKEGDGLAEIYCLIGDLHARRHQDGEAERSYDLCSDAADAAKDDYSGIRAVGSLARLTFERGEIERAATLSERALAGIEKTRTSIPEADLRTSFFSSMRSYYDLAITVLECLDDLHPHEDYQWLAFLTAERARSRMLLDEVHSNLDETPRSSPALLAEYDSVQASLRRAEKRLGEAGAAPAKGMRETVARLTVQDHALAAEIAATRKADTEAQPLTLPGLQADLAGQHRALAEYWTGPRGSFLWIVDVRGIRCQRLPGEARLKPRIDSFVRQVLSVANQDPRVTAEQRGPLRSMADAETRRQAAALRPLLLPAGTIPAGTQSLLIVGDGPVLSVPFAALLDEASFCSRCTLLAEPSTTFLHDLLSRPVPPGGSGRIAIFTEAEATASREPMARSGDAPAELPFALQEAQAVRTVFGPGKALILTGARASPEAIKSFDWGSFTIGHFATHATLNRENLQLTGMLLPSREKAGAPGTGTLWYGDICQLHARLALVVLSACDTANGENVPGEGLTGLTHAFFTAGAQRVLGSLWPVDDEATSVLMREFYVALQANRSPALALRTAQRKLAETERWRAPYYWAGFSLAGDWRDLP